MQLLMNVLRNCVTKFTKIQTVGTVTKLSETEEIKERIYIYR